MIINVAYECGKRIDLLTVQVDGLVQERHNPSA